MSISLTEPQLRRGPQLGGFGSVTMEKSDGGVMDNFESISVGGVCEITFDGETKDYRGKPVSERDNPSEQTAKLTTFRVTSSDELNLIAGLFEWPSNAPEIRPVDLLQGIAKHNELKRRGSISLVPARDGNLLAPLKVMKFNPDRGYFTLHGATEEEMDELLGHSFKAFLLEVGALDFGTRGSIDTETGKMRTQLAVKVKPGDLRTLALAYTLTRPVAVIKDFGMEL